MINEGKKIELLAPAGDVESLKAAVNNGADAVYLGGRYFSARSKAANFDRDQLARAVTYCHIFNVRVYLAVNIVIRPEEYESAAELISYADSAGVDAFIMQDLTFISYIHSILPGIVIHLSTQAGVHNLSGAKVAEALGVKRVVLSRETTLADIKKIREETGLEIECFVHGALCVAFSGNCYLSSLASGLSGNRGKCLQLCRKKYSCGEQSGYLLSAKDVNASDDIESLIDAGVTSFKIEGRMRKPEYIGGVVAHYRRLLDGEQSDETVIKRLFNRGDYCSAYLRNPTENVIYPYIQGHKGLKIGSVETVKNAVAKLKIGSSLNEGDGIKFVRRGYEVGNASIKKSGRTTTFAGDVKPGDEVYITTDSDLEKKIAETNGKLKVYVSLSTEGNRLIAEAKCGETEVTVVSGIVLQDAKNAPLIYETYKRCFEKGGDLFRLDKFECTIYDKFIMISLLNRFRRWVYEDLENALLEAYKKRRKKEALHSTMQTARMSQNTHVGCRRFEYNEGTTIAVSNERDCDRLLAAADFVAYRPTDYTDVAVARDVAERLGKRGMLVLPIMLRDGDYEAVENLVALFDNVIVNNVGNLCLCDGKNVLLGTCMNVINPTIEYPCVLSPEYDGRRYGNQFGYVFGNVAVCTFAHCPNKTLHGGSCAGKKCNFLRRGAEYVDEEGNAFRLEPYKIDYCYCQMLNSVPIKLFDKASELGITNFYYDFCGYSVDYALGVLSGEVEVTEFTRGYGKRRLT